MSTRVSEQGIKAKVLCTRRVLQYSHPTSYQGLPAPRKRRLAVPDSLKQTHTSKERRIQEQEPEQDQAKVR